MTPEQRTAYWAKVCVHFTGIGVPQCKAGVAYESFSTGLRLPCLPSPDGAEQATCPAYRADDPERLAKEEAADNRFSRQCTRAREKIMEQHFATGVNAGQLLCPICANGTLHWRRSPSNGHIQAACGTPKCVRWIE